jgi:DNA-binding XRE family transcriptional regulator
MSNPWIKTQYGTGRFNRPFFELREKRGWTQTEMGDALGYNAHTVCRIENGISGGKLDLWQRVQKTFDIPDEKMWALMNGRETT